MCFQRNLTQPFFITESSNKYHLKALARSYRLTEDDFRRCFQLEHRLRKNRFLGNVFFYYFTQKIILKHRKSKIGRCYGTHNSVTNTLEKENLLQVENCKRHVLSKVPPLYPFCIHNKKTSKQNKNIKNKYKNTLV